MGVMRPDLAMRNIIPVVMAGVLGIYGLIVAVIIGGQIGQPSKQVWANPAGGDTYASGARAPTS